MLARTLVRPQGCLQPDLTGRRAHCRRRPAGSYVPMHRAWKGGGGRTDRLPGRSRAGRLADVRYEGQKGRYGASTSRTPADRRGLCSTGGAGGGSRRRFPTPRWRVARAGDDLHSIATAGWKPSMPSEPIAGAGTACGRDRRRCSRGPKGYVRRIGKDRRLGGVDREAAWSPSPPPTSRSAFTATTDRLTVFSLPIVNSL